ncbi:MAG TPA: hypothetical protein VL576_01715 [Candidatus Paceibacterota bacterium]|nr:hypothetical protein [Candidatus Paceibacterota bacterium]
MKEIFKIEGKITKETAEKFKLFLKKFTKKGQVIRIHLDSWGGNSGAGKDIEGYIYFMKKYHKSRFIMKAPKAASAAFRIFIRGDERIIDKNSIIQPHLPVPNKPGVSEEKIAREQKSDLDFITGTIPLLSKEDILMYNDMPLPLQFMKEKGVITKVVSSI